MNEQILVNNILNEYWLASDNQIADGTAWYPMALVQAKILDGSGDGRVGAGVIAALSPLAPWGKNLERARLAFARGSAAGLTFGQHTRKADAILMGAEPLDVLSGPKTRAFYECLLGSRTAVTVDRHAFDVAVGRVTDDKTRKFLDRKGGYEQIADAYRFAGEWAGLEPRTLQAITWVSWRQRKGLDWADV